jgi:flagellar biosynthesis protein FliR
MSLFSNLTTQQSQNLAYVLVAVAAFLMFAPPQYQMYVPVQMDMQTKQMVAVAAAALAYYFYNGQKFSS